MTGEPAGVGASFTGGAGASSTLTLNVGASVAVGTYNLTVTGTVGTVTATRFGSVTFTATVATGTGGTTVEDSVTLTTWGVQATFFTDAGAGGIAYVWQIMLHARNKSNQPMRVEEYSLVGPGGFEPPSGSFEGQGQINPSGNDVRFGTYTLTVRYFADGLKERVGTYTVAAPTPLATPTGIVTTARRGYYSYSFHLVATWTTVPEAAMYEVQFERRASDGVWRHLTTCAYETPTARCEHGSVYAYGYYDASGVYRAYNTTDPFRSLVRATDYRGEHLGQPDKLPLALRRSAWGESPPVTPTY